MSKSTTIFIFNCFLQHDDSVDESPEIHFEPVIKLPEIEVKSLEEEEEEVSEVVHFSSLKASSTISFPTSFPFRIVSIKASILGR